VNEIIYPFAFNAATPWHSAGQTSTYTALFPQKTSSSDIRKSSPWSNKQLQEFKYAFQQVVHHCACWHSCGQHCKIRQECRVSPYSTHKGKEFQELMSLSSEHTSNHQASTSSRISKRSATYQNCTAEQMVALDVAVADAISLATAAYTAASTHSDCYTSWFKTTRQTRKVRSIYASVMNIETTSPTIYCEDSDMGD
jgi:hypothetical protein